MNIYKDFVIVHNMTLDPRDVKLFVDWLLACEKESLAYKVGEAMQAAVENYCDNYNFEGDYRITNTLCTHCKGVKEND